MYFVVLIIFCNFYVRTYLTTFFGGRIVLSMMSTKQTVEVVNMKVQLTRYSVGGEMQVRFIVLREDEALKAISRGKMKWGPGPVWSVQVAF